MGEPSENELTRFLQICRLGFDEVWGFKKHQIDFFIFLAANGNPWSSNSDYRRETNIQMDAVRASRELKHLTGFVLQRNEYSRCGSRYRLSRGIYIFNIMNEKLL